MTLSLAYMGFESKRLREWQEFATIVGFHTDRQGDSLFLRMDEKKRRIILVEGPSEDYVFSGLEATSLDEYECCVQRLERAGVEIRRGTSAGAELRGVDRYAGFHEPSGLAIELAYGCEAAATPFASAHLDTGFVTGLMGLGHIAVVVSDHAASENFLVQHLGARLTDRVITEIPAGRVNGSFLHLNTRHHSFAFVSGPFNAEKRINHFMVQVPEVIDVLKAKDRLEQGNIRISRSLGQHPNDRAVSFYCTTPSGFDCEVAAPAVPITPGWQVSTYDVFSLWGHR